MSARFAGEVDPSALARLLRFLAKGSVQIAATADPDKLLLESQVHGVISVGRQVVDHALGAGLAMRCGALTVICDAGRARLRREDAAGEPFAGQHRIEETATIGPVQICANCAESPLAMLRKRKDGSGRPLIGEAAFKAGERLRGDFTLGSMMPSVGVNWDLSGSG
ncbi:MAG: DUF6456 domain-containing protein, partial [Alphaproteobacteria bacterium]